MPYNHTATGSPNERELTPEEYRQLNREIQEMRMTKKCAHEIGPWPVGEQWPACLKCEIERLRGQLNFANREPPHCPSCNCGSVEPIEALPHASEALKQFMSELGEIMGMEDGTKPADYLQRAQDIRQWCSDHQTLPPWIPITERVPEPEVLVLCWDGYKTFVEWFGSKPDAGRGVTHWVPYRMPPGAASNMHDGRRAFTDRPEKRAEPSEPLDKKSFERNCGHYHFQDYCDECNRVWSLIDSGAPRQEAAERRWSLLTHILDESAETGELPSGLHEAFQMGGDAMAEWLDRSPMPWNPTTSSDVSIHDQTPQKSEVCPTCARNGGVRPCHDKWHSSRT